MLERSVWASFMPANNYGCFYINIANVLSEEAEQLTISSKNRLLILYIFMFKLVLHFQIGVLFCIGVYILSWKLHTETVATWVRMFKSKNPDLFITLLIMSWGEIYGVQNSLRFKRDCAYRFSAARFSPAQGKVMEYSRINAL